MKKYVIFILLFLMCCDAYSFESVGRKWWEFWKPKNDIKNETIQPEPTKKIEDGLNRFGNFNYIRGADVEGDTINLYAENRIVKYNTLTDEFTYVEAAVEMDKTYPGIHVTRWKEFVPDWFPRGCCYEINSIGKDWKVRMGNNWGEPNGNNIPEGYVLLTIMNEGWRCTRQELLDIENKKGYVFACENITCFVVKNDTALLGTDMGVIRLDLKTNYRVRFVAMPEYRYICGVGEYRNGFYFATDAGLYFLNNYSKKTEPVEVFNGYCAKNKLKLLAMKKDDNVMYATAENVLLIYNASTGDFEAVLTGVPAASSIEILDKKVFVYGTDYICDEGDCVAIGGAFFYDKSSGQITKATNFPVLAIKRGNEGILAHTVAESAEFVLVIDSVINTETMKSKIYGAKYQIFDTKQTSEILARQKERLLYYTKYYLDLIKESGAPFEETVEPYDKRSRLWLDPTGVSNERYERRKLFEKYLSGFFCYNDVIVRAEPAGEVINY